jgi:hypothetical protein
MPRGMIKRILRRKSLKKPVTEYLMCVYWRRLVTLVAAQHRCDALSVATYPLAPWPNEVRLTDVCRGDESQRPVHFLYLLMMTTPHLAIERINGLGRTCTV